MKLIVALMGWQQYQSLRSGYLEKLAGTKFKLAGTKFLQVSTLLQPKRLQNSDEKDAVRVFTRSKRQVSRRFLFLLTELQHFTRWRDVVTLKHCNSQNIFHK